MEGRLHLDAERDCEDIDVQLDLDRAHEVGTASVGAYINYLEPSRALSSYYGTNY